MSDEKADAQVNDLLRAIGRVPEPAARVLDDAREALWSAVAGEILGLGPARHETARRRQTGQSRSERNRSAGGGDPHS